MVAKMEKESTTADGEDKDFSAATAAGRDGPPSEAAAAAALTTLVGKDELSHSSDDQKVDGERKKQEADDGAVFYEEGDEGKDFRVPVRLTKSGRKRATPFPIKLMKVLSERENAEVIAWTPSGKAFMVLQPKVFCTRILPDEFKSAKYSSFTRKLHRWGFMRHYRGPDAGAFYHKHFQKGRVDLVEKMSCYKPVNAKQDFSSGVPEPSPLDSDSLPGTGPAAGSPEEESSKSNADLTSFGSGGMAQQQGNQVAVQDPQAAVGQQQQPQQHQMPMNFDGQGDLNAAIELEVARRLKERINAAAFSRQMMMMPATAAPQQQAPAATGMVGFDPTNGGNFMYPAASAQTNAAAMTAAAPMGNMATMPMAFPNMNTMGMPIMPTTQLFPATQPGATFAPGMSPMALAQTPAMPMMNGGFAMPHQQHQPPSTLPQQQQQPQQAPPQQPPPPNQAPPPQQHQQFGFAGNQVIVNDPQNVANGLVSGNDTNAMDGMGPNTKAT